ncbi:MAG TPA: N-acetyltransferase [Chitinophagaceae bacterium]|jgi:ribosomal protein S18 acetylase RimI-like enzyme|nr:N-acetyltransferase [Chitinophagaceae bacterium]
MFEIRQAKSEDLNKVYKLYKKVATATTGLARSGDEITDDYVQSFMKNSSDSGIELVIDNPDNPDQIIAEVHCYRLVPRTFSHILTELTIAVDPDHQGKGIGRMIFTHLLDLIKNNRPDVLRVELISRETNLKAISFYESIGFIREGRFEKRIKSDNNELEADIPMAWFNPNFEQQPKRLSI